jgi:hypothetical protein
MIKDLTVAFDNDWPELIEFLRARVIERMLQVKGEWQFNFDARNGWQQVFLKNWLTNKKLSVHYEFHLHRGCLTVGKFMISVDIEGGGNAEYQLFRTLFEKQLPALQSQYDAKQIAYQSRDRKGSIATKWFDFTPDLSRIDIECIQALEEFLFLTEPINQVIGEMNIAALRTNF